jgi:hypothetical protein
MAEYDLLNEIDSTDEFRLNEMIEILGGVEGYVAHLEHVLTNTNPLLCDYVMEQSTVPNVNYENCNRSLALMIGLLGEDNLPKITIDALKETDNEYPTATIEQMGSILAHVHDVNPEMAKWIYQVNKHFDDPTEDILFSCLKLYKLLENQAIKDRFADEDKMIRYARMFEALPTIGFN